MASTHKVELEILSEVSRITNSGLELREKLQEIVQYLAPKTGQDVCSIFLMRRDHRSICLKATVGLNPDVIDKVRLPMGEGITGWVALEKKPVALEDAASDPRFKYFPDSWEEQFRSILSAPIIDRGQCLGVLNVQTREPHRYTDDEVTLFTTISNDLGGIIRNTQLYIDARQRAQKLTVLYDIGRALTSTLDLATLLRLIARSSAEVLGARACILRILDRETGMLRVRASHGIELAQAEGMDIRLGEGIAGKVASEGKPLLVEDVSAMEEPFRVFSYVAPASLLCVPLGFKDQVIGIITLFDKEKDPSNESNVFTEEDLQLLSMLASQASVAVENAFIYDRAERLAEENRRRVQELSTLYDISYAMRRTIKLTQLCHVILTGATIGDGLGFNRAMLFIVNERMNVLEGMMGVGPSNAPEAWTIWSDLARSGRTILDFPLGESDEFEVKDTPMNQLVRKIRVPLEDRTSLLARSVSERRSFNIVNAAEDPLVDPGLVSKIGSNAFALVPLVARDHAIGVLLVDNLFSGKAIDEENMQFLAMFANQAGLAIENARMYHNLEQANKNLREAQNKLIQAEKMAALGQMAAGIAHEIRNPLVSIGGFARRLAGRVADESQEKRYAEIIIKEVRRIEKIIQDILTFSKDSAPAMEECSVNDIVEDALGLYIEDLTEGGCRIIKELTPDLPAILVDPQQLMQVLTNVISNAEQAMGGGGELAVKTFIADTAGSVAISIADTGGGIPEDIMGNIFTPFFTTKVAGTGLGLSICHRIIEKHEGRIEVRSEQGRGTKFIIKLPYRRERRTVKREQPK